MQKLVTRFIKDESGAAAIEYALIAGLIALVIVGGATVLGNAISTKFSNLGTSVTNAGK
jgi:pilus assembly protein Flp/PilA